jgi:phage gp37-like protein
VTALVDIDGALYTALAVTQHAGTATDAAPFAIVTRYAGELSEEGIREVVAQYPAAVLRWDAGVGARSIDAVEGVEDVATEAWTVFVALEESREMDSALSATNTGAPGAYTLIERVLSACNGLVTDGLWRDRRVRAVAWGPALIKRGVVYVYSVRFEARRVLPQLALTVAQAGTAQTLTQIAGDVDLEGTADAAPNPIVQFQTF